MDFEPYDCENSFHCQTQKIAIQVDSNKFLVFAMIHNQKKSKTYDYFCTLVLGFGTLLKVVDEYKENW